MKNKTKNFFFHFVDWNRQATDKHSSHKSKSVKNEQLSPIKEGSSSRNPSTKSSPSRKCRQSDNHLTTRETNNFDQSVEKNSSREHDRKPSRQPSAIVQAEQAKKKLEDDLYEMSKPLARYADDDDLDKFLREQERSEDPMFDYFKRKKMKKEAKEGKGLLKQINLNAYLLYISMNLQWIYKVYNSTSLSVVR